MNNPPRHEQVSVEQVVMRYPIRDWAPLFEYVIRGLRGLRPGEVASWPVGKLLRPAQDAQLFAIDLFRQEAPGLIAITRNPDLVARAKDRQARERLDLALDNFQTRLNEITEKLTEIATNARAWMVAVTPLSGGDVVGEMRDAEIRRWLQAHNAKDRFDIMSDMIKGEHPALVNAVLRGPDPIISGLKPEQVKRLDAAGIAANHADDIRALAVMVDAMEDARITMSRSARALAVAGNLAVKHSDLGQRINTMFMPAPVVGEFRAWLSSIPVDNHPVGSEEREEAA